MVYYNIIKIELIEGVITHTKIGYISPVNKPTFELVHGSPFVDWVEANPELSLEGYFETNEPCYMLDTVSSIQEGLNLITNLITLE